MVDEKDVEALLSGQALVIPQGVVSGGRERFVEIVPIHSRRNGEVVRFVIRYGSGAPQGGRQPVTE